VIYKGISAVPGLRLRRVRGSFRKLTLIPVAGGWTGRRITERPCVLLGAASTPVRQITAEVKFQLFTTGGARTIPDEREGREYGLLAPGTILDNFLGLGVGGLERLKAR